MSIDPIKKHEKFINKHELPYPLISDVEKQLVADYGVWVQKRLFSNTFMGIERSTFVIDEEGKIEAILEKVKPATHLEKLLEVLKS